MTLIRAIPAFYSRRRMVEDPTFSLDLFLWTPSLTFLLVPSPPPHLAGLSEASSLLMSMSLHSRQSLQKFLQSLDWRHLKFCRVT